MNPHTKRPREILEVIKTLRFKRPWEYVRAYFCAGKPQGANSATFKVKSAEVAWVETPEFSKQELERPPGGREGGGRCVVGLALCEQLLRVVSPAQHEVWFHALRSLLRHPALLGKSSFWDSGTSSINPVSLRGMVPSLGEALNTQPWGGLSTPPRRWPKVNSLQGRRQCAPGAGEFLFF